MKKLLLIIISLSLLFTYSCKKDDNGNNDVLPELIYHSSLINPPIDTLVSFYEKGYTIIDGNVELKGLSNLVWMGTFLNVNKITGSLLIENNYNLYTLEGLNRLTKIGGNFSIIEQYDILPSLNELDSLSTIGGNLIIELTRIEDFEGLNNLDSVHGDFSIMSNFELKNSVGLGDLVYIGGDLMIQHNRYLENLDGFASLNSINEDVFINENTSLSDYCGLSGVISSNGVSDSIYIQNNLFNPTVEDIIAGNCSLD